MVIKPWVQVMVEKNIIEYSEMQFLKYIDVLSMGVSALESHSNGKKHKINTSWSIQKFQHFFLKSFASSAEAKKYVENSLSENTCKNIISLDHIIAIINNSLNVEIIWHLKVVNAI